MSYIPFRPYRGLEVDILNKPYNDGYVYFATDTKKIYMDANGQTKMPMGGNSGIYYGIMKLSETPDENQKEFEFSIYDIDGNYDSSSPTIPNIDDLILNIPDGCFYRVMSIDNVNGEIIINTEKLTIAGTGGGGGTGDGPGSAAGVIFNRLTNQVVTTLYQKNYSIGFYVKATDGSGEVTGNGTYELFIGGQKKATGVVFNDQDNYLEIGKYLNLEHNTVKVVVYMDTGGSSSTSASKTWQITTTMLNLTWDYNEVTTHNISDPFTLRWSVSGSGISKTTHIKIDDKYSIPVGPTTVNDQTYTIENPAEYNLIHGAHKFELYASAVVDGDTIILDSIIKNIIFVEPSNATTIISCSFFDTDITQYDTIQIPIIIYNENNVSGDATISLFENGVLRDTWENCENQVVYNWAYTPVSAGTSVLTIQSGTEDITLTLNVKALDIDNDEVGGYAFRFKASEFASNSAVQNWNSNNVTATFSNKFDWINGGLKTEKDEQGNNRQYIRIKAGSTMTINYPLFKIAPQTAGKVFKMIFKAAKCRDYDAQILSCKEDRQVVGINNNDFIALDIPNGTELQYSSSTEIVNGVKQLVNPQKMIFDLTSENSIKLLKKIFISYNDDLYYCKEVESTEEDGNTYYFVNWLSTYIKESYLGLVMQAQETFFNSSNSSIEVPYCEDSYIEFEIDISKYSSDGKMYIKTWMDGIPTGIQNYTLNDDFVQSNPVNITIGSDDCDVYLYMLKVYENHLTDEEHLANFISDAPNAEEMLARYRRNDILDERGEISPTKLAAANPNCKVHIYTIDRMTQNKKDKVKGCTYVQYQGSDQAQLSSENTTIKVQGTSSAAYGLAAYNIDADFAPDGVSTLVDGEGNVLEDGWSMNEGSIPCTYFTTKVNVASAEQANNALNQEWYNRFQPYKSVLRCKKENARDTMEFTPGVLFIVDKNKTVNDTENLANNNVFNDTIGYVDNPYPKLYSICNMGNSKDNIHVFHDLDNPLECCIEVSDNQKPQQWMVDDIFLDENIDPPSDDYSEFYSFRYPDGRKEASDQMIKGWREFVTWMAHRNPQPMYNQYINVDSDKFAEISINPETKNPIDVYVLKDENIGYELVTAYDSSITTYYTKTANIYGYTNLPLPIYELTLDTIPKANKKYYKKSGDTYVEYDVSAGFLADIAPYEKVQKTFEPYTFQGYKTDLVNPATGELWQKDYNPIIAGYTISTYARDNTNPYTHDTYEYRMAKMISECEEHLVMDSIIFHYLFIERHCMIDNVAKNTFWSTEDCKHWNLIKDYDNDTADGNDNNGKFTRSYGMEALDKLNENEYVFNARQSVWLNFIHGLQGACQHVYNALETVSFIENNEIVNKNAWAANDYLDTFNRWQKTIPERCWIEAYYRLYERPYKVYNDDMFLPMMEGGPKTHQRRQFETYQNYYMSSKYYGKEASSSSIVIRGSGDGKLGYKLPVQMYADCYIQAAIGQGQEPNIKMRVKRNEVNYIECPIDDLNNTTFYMYLAQLYQKIGDAGLDKDGKPKGNLSGFAPAQLSVARAPKLRELVLGTIDSTINESLTTVGFENNDLLEILYAANCPSATVGLNLTNAPNLRKLDARGSGFTEITIADNAPVYSIQLESPTTLILSNLTDLEEFNIEDYTSLTQVQIDNIDNSTGVNSKNIIESAMDYLSKYRLRNVQWSIDDSSEISNDKINIIETLYTKKTPVTNLDDTGLPYPISTSLTGELNIASAAYNGNNSFAIYDRYAQDDVYPNLDINFEGSAAKLYSVTIYDGNNNINWTRKTLPNSYMDELFLSDGPNGEFDLSNIYKASTAANTYLFEGKWNVYNSNDLTTVIETIDREDGMPLYSKAITHDITIIPVFITSVREYYIEFLDADGTPLQPGRKYPYGTPMSDLLADLTSIPYKDDSLLGLTETYNFVGYGLIKDSTNVVSEQYFVTNDQTFYPVFNLVNDIRTIVHPEYFTIIENITVGDRVGARIIPAKTLKGKITIPSSYNNLPIISIGGFGSQSGVSPHKVTHIFFEKNSNLLEVGNRSFENMTSLKYFDFTQDTVKYIRSYAFKTCPLINTTISANTEIIGEGAFNLAFFSDSPVTFTIPAKVKSIDRGGFNILKFAKGTNVVIGSAENPSILDLSLPNLTTQSAIKFSQNPNEAFNSIVFHSSLYGSADDKVSSVADDMYTVAYCFGNLHGASLTVN